MRRLFPILLFIHFLSIHLTAQINSEQFDQSNFDEAAIQQKLEENGVDLNDFSPLQIDEIEAALQQAILELQLEQQQALAGFDTIPPVDTIPLSPDSTVLNNDITLSDSLALDTTGQEETSRIFGQHVFNNNDIEVYDRSKNKKASESYILGAGDELSVAFWGESQRSFSFQINESGYIKPEKQPRIYLSGLSLTQARELLRKQFQKYYVFRPNQFEINLIYARDITINIVGEVVNFGSFTLPATNTAFNALMAAGGPTDIGSVRNIRLIRSGEKSSRIDMYDYLLNPGVASNFYLQENDFIHVEVADKVVEIEGAIKRAFQYELIEDEGLMELLDYAGGLSENAFRDNIQIKRLEGSQYILVDVNLSELIANGRNFSLQNGDVISIKEIATPLEEFVEASGAVRFSGQYAYEKGMRVSDLMEKVVLENSARMDIAFIIKMSVDSSISYQKLPLLEALENPKTEADFLLEPRDRILVLTQSDFIDNAEVVVKGAVRNPQNYPYNSTGLKVEDAILLAGGLRLDATSFAYIHRGDPSYNRSIQYIRVDLDKALAEPNSIANVALTPFDTLVVFSKLTFRDEKTVQVKGAVRNPGEFQFDESLTLKDVLTIAGGLRPEAATNRIDIFRLDYKNNEPTKTVYRTLEVDENLDLVGAEGEVFQLLASDQIVVRQAPEYFAQQNVNILGEVKYPGTYALTNKNETISTLIQHAGGLTDASFVEGATLYRTDRGKGFVILDLKEALNNKKSAYNYILKAGDIIEIPGKEELVTIHLQGTKAAELYPAKVITQGKFNVAYLNGKNAKWYIDQHAAGLGRKAKKKYITVEHANGSIERTRGFLFFRKYPDVRKGSVVSVGEKQKKKKTREKKEREKIPVKQIVAETLAQVTAVVTLILLINRI